MTPPEANRRTWYVIAVGDLHLVCQPIDDRVKADRFREQVNGIVIPVVPLADLPEPLNTELRHTLYGTPTSPMQMGTGGERLPTFPPDVQSGFGGEP